MAQPGFRLVAVCDVDPAQADALFVRAGVPAVPCYTDHRAMLAAHPELDLVAIATPSGTHGSIALACIDAGLHVVVEKPVALSMADADAVVQAAQRRDVRVAVCHQNRFNPAVQAVRRALETGCFGALSHGSAAVRWNRDDAYYGQASWRGTWDQDGGCLMNQCIHAIDLLLWMMGPAVEVFGATRNCFHPSVEGEDVGVAVVTFASGAVATVEGTVNVYPRNLEETLCLFGSHGTACLGGAAVDSVEAWHFPSHAGEPKAPLASEATADVYGNGHMALYADMREAIATHRAPYVDACAGRDALELVLAIYKSQLTGLPVRLPLGDFSALDMRRGEGRFMSDIRVHPTAVVDDGAQVGEGTVVWHFCHIQAGAQVGRDCMLGQNVYVAEGAVVGDGCKIQNNVSVYEGVELGDQVFCGPSCVFTNDLTPRAAYPKGRARRVRTLVGEGASIGANVTVVCGHTIGPWAMVGAGAVVASDVEPHALVYGVPARRQGWVCRCGESLDTNLACPACGRLYRRASWGLEERT